MTAKLCTKNPKDYFVYWRDENRKLKTVRGGINRIANLADRFKAGMVICNSINNRLAAGVDPRDPTRPTRSAIQTLTDLANSKQNHLRRRSWQSYVYAVDMLAKYLKDRPVRSLEDLTRTVARQFIDSLQTKGYNAYTINGVKGFLSALCNAYDEDYPNPFRGIKRVPTQTGRNIAFTPKQVDEIRAALDPDMLLFTRFIYFTYIRPLELLRLRVGDVQGDQIVITGANSKNKRQQWVVIPEAFRADVAAMELHRYPADWYLFGSGLKRSDQSYSRNSVSRRHSTVLRALGYSSDYTLYSWKHTGVVAAYKAGIDIYNIMRQLRHHSLDMTQVYLKSLGLIRNDEFGSKMR